MPGSGNLTAAIARLNACLADVDAHLGRAGPFSAPVPVSAFSRMAFALAILEQEAASPLKEALADLDGILKRIHHAQVSVPESCDPGLNPAWEHLTEFLEKLLDRLDAGGTPADLAGDPGWEEAAGRLARAAGPVAVMDTLSDAMAAWAARWDRGDLDEDAARDLHGRWMRLRDRGDRLFGRGVFDSLAARPGKNL